MKDTMGISQPSDTDAREPRKAKPLPQNGELYAALDLGTNNCRLLIAPEQSGLTYLTSILSSTELA